MYANDPEKTLMKIDHAKGGGYCCILMVKGERLAPFGQFKSKSEALKVGTQRLLQLDPDLAAEFRGKP